MKIVEVVEIIRELEDGEVVETVTESRILEEAAS